jgi:hypothetical protein
MLAVAVAELIYLVVRVPYVQVVLVAVVVAVLITQILRQALQTLAVVVAHVV